MSRLEIMATIPTAALISMRRNCVGHPEIPRETQSRPFPAIARILAVWSAIGCAVTRRPFD
jgi:hypothetical protein